MRRVSAIAAAIALVIMLLAARESQAAPGNTECTGSIGPGTAATTITGDLHVPANATCTLDFVNVTGNIVLMPGSNLVISAYDEPSTIGGSINADSCGTAVLRGTVTVAKNVQITNCTGTGTNGFQGPDVQIGGNFQCANNVGPCMAWLGVVQGNVMVQSNSFGTSDVSLVSVSGNLICAANHSLTHSRGPNWVSGNSIGQCVDFSTTTTSIGEKVTPVASCAALASIPAANFPVPNTVITSAVDTPATSTLPERCIVNGFVNSHISPVDNCTYQNSFQVQLPLPAAWNGRFFGQGGGGTEGSVPTATGTNSGSAGSNFGVTQGYAVASQDGGHENSQLSAPTCDSGFRNTNEFYADPMGTIANAYQSIEVTTIVAKYLINEYYGDGPDHSYWVGCSTGGRQGMVMSEAFPQFYDGIVAGDPVYDLESIQLGGIWGIQNMLNVYNTTVPPLPTLKYLPGTAPEIQTPIVYPAFPAADQSLFETALLQACDALDGVADGIVDDVPMCNATFNPATATYVSGGNTHRLQCTGAKDSTCLSPAQIQAVVNIHQGAQSGGEPQRAPAGAAAPYHVDNAVPGYIYDGGFFTTVSVPQRNIGSPTSSPGFVGTGLTQFPYAFIAPANPGYDYLSFNYATDVGILSTSTPIVTNSTSLDISKFIKYGHKIIWYHGLSDPGPPVQGTIKYYNELADRSGGLQQIQSFSRFYGVPNMDHCTGGATTDQFDMLSPLVDWVENGTGPGPITARGVNFNAATYQVGFVTGAPDNAPTTRSRKLCPYPQQARFMGGTTQVNGVPVATNPTDLANDGNYTCVTPPGADDNSAHGNGNGHR